MSHMGLVRVMLCVFSAKYLLSPMLPSLSLSLPLSLFLLPLALQSQSAFTALLCERGTDVWKQSNEEKTLEGT